MKTDRKYLVCTDSKNATEENRYYRECEARKVPYIRVIPKRKYSTVDWDHNSIPVPLDDKLAANIDQIWKQLAAAFDRYGVRKSDIICNAWTGNIRRLEPQAAEALAAEVFDIITAHLAA